MSGSIGLDLGNPDNLASIDALILAGIMTTQNRADLLALATTPGPSWADPNWGVTLTAGDVDHARSL